MPQYLELKNADLIAIDIETKDPSLNEKHSAPSQYKGDGYICGVSLATKDGFSEYYNLGHPDVTLEEKEKNEKYLRHQLALTMPKVGANIIYDLDWLINWGGYSVGGKYFDVQYAEPLIDENQRSFSLETLAQKYLGKGKHKTEIEAYCIEHGLKGDPRRHIYKMPYSTVKKYACVDAAEPIEILGKQLRILKDQDLLELFDLECDLIPLLLQMRKIGIRIDQSKIEPTIDIIDEKKLSLEKEAYSYGGTNFDLRSTKQTAGIFNKIGIEMEYNDPTPLMRKKGLAKGNPKLDKHALNRIEHPLAKIIKDYRHISQLKSLYLEPYPKMIVNGRIHATFNPLRADEGGTVSGRFSGSKPNLQQPSKISEENLGLGKIIRELFLPEKGHDFLSVDLSQIEYRLLAHYAINQDFEGWRKQQLRVYRDKHVLSFEEMKPVYNDWQNYVDVSKYQKDTSADDLRQSYIDDPYTDYHQKIGDLTGLTERKLMKNLNFGTMYYMGPLTMSNTFGWSLDRTKELHSIYHTNAPFVRSTGDAVMGTAKKRGWIKTLLNRRRRLVKPDEAYKMLNGLIQGSAADLLKKAMVKAFKGGVFNVLPVHLTVHDELDCSLPRNKAGIDAAKELKYIMENCIKLKVPVIADVEIGKNWGQLEKIKALNVYYEKNYSAN